MKGIISICILFVCLSAAYGQTAPTGKAPEAPHARAATPHKQPERFNPYLADTLVAPVPLSRALFYDRIDNEQKLADAVDGNTDQRITIRNNEAASDIFTKALITDVDRLQILIENMPDVARDTVKGNQLRIQSLRALWEMLRQYSIDPRPQPDYYLKLVDNMRDLIVAINENKSLDYVIAQDNIYTLNNSKVLLADLPESRAYIYSSMGVQDPRMMIRRLEEYATDTFAPRIIAAAARLEPKLVFNYAMSSNLALKKAVYGTHDSFVQAIVRTTAESAQPLRALPFISYLYTNSKTIDEIDSIAADPARSFNMLVGLRQSKEPLSAALYTDELEYRSLKNFVRQLNELHDTTEDVRFRCLDSLPASSLYYIMVYGREEIYTSSFLGTFKRMMERMPPMRSDAFLESLHYDHFRSFIRLCAGYNTLPELLDSMNEQARTAVMTKFIGGLENGSEDDLEDAVNVADALGSITDAKLMQFLRGKIADNYRISKITENRKGMAIYNLLSMLAETNAQSGTDAGAISASARLKIPPINIVPYSTLTNDTGVVHERIFFYGDDDGQTAYAGFMADYRRNNKWKTDTNKYWATISSTEGKPIVMYANRPLKAPEDEKAIDSLDNYLASYRIHASVVIHRGHSYHVKTTIAHLDTFAHIVVLGSCGGYQNVAKVLEASHDAHIISSKQTGVGAINEPITREINSQLREGNNINWITTWATLDEYFSKQERLYERYKDYVPPHKNSGVIFIKAYRQLMHIK